MKPRSRGDRVFDTVNYILLGLVLVSVLYPLLFVLSASISNPNYVTTGRMWLWPVDITFEGYLRIFRSSEIWLGYRNTLVYTGVGTAINIVMTMLGAYPLACREFPGKNFFSAMFAVTAFFNGGIVPTYLLVQGLGLTNTIWSMVLPNAVSVWLIIIVRTNIKTSIPEALLDSVQIDGCSHIKTLLLIVIPLIKPVIAVIALFYGVAHWNSYFNALIYLTDDSLYPLQIILRNILVQNQTMSSSVRDLLSMAEQQLVAESIKYGVIIVASLPLLIIYPFMQKYFVKGVMVGAVKG